MNEEFVKKISMNEVFENSVIGAEMDPKVVMDLSIFNVGGCNTVRSSIQKMFETFMDENEPWLLIGIPNRHVADRYWLHENHGGDEKFTEELTTYFVRRPVCRWNAQKMQSESSEYVRTETVFSTNSLENQNGLGELLWRICERRW